MTQHDTVLNDIREGAQAMMGAIARTITEAIRAGAAQAQAAVEAERQQQEMELAVAKEEARFQAVGGLLARLAQRREQLEATLAKAKGPMALAYRRQLDVLADQEAQLLAQFGVIDETPRLEHRPAATVDADTDPGVVTVKGHTRRRRAALNGTHGHTD